MRKSLVIVESPAKATKIGKILGSDYIVESSVGHIRDLPANASEVPAEHKGKPWASMGVDTDHDFDPVWVINPDKKKTVANLRKLMKGVDELILATDKDREGEAIAWHLLEVLQPKVPVRRMVFGEITDSAIKQAVEHTIDMDDRLVDAAEARRILDRLYGYELSPVLWKKVNPGLSAGRVQSVATRVIVQRERERMAFVSADYWDLSAQLTKDGDRSDSSVEGGAPFAAGMTALDGTRLATGKDFSQQGQLAAKGVIRLNQAQAEALSAGLADAPFTVTSVETKPYRRKPPAPFSTSTLQQEAGRKLRFTTQRTMQVAQRLYENGYITYMRTDSTMLSDTAIRAARKQINDAYGPDYLPEKPRIYAKKSKNAQEAHEAVRPAGETFRTPDSLKRELGTEERRLYELIWMRTVASQMEDAVGQTVSARFEAQVTGADAPGKVAQFSASGRTITFPGFLRAYVEGSDDPEEALADRETYLPPLAEGDVLAASDVTAEGHLTWPPARYNEPKLVQKLEELEVGRPSTYASIISTIIGRGYVWKKAGALVPSFTAFAVVSLLERHFSHLVDYEFTARMEDDLDQIAAGNVQRTPWLSRFYFGGPPEGDQVAMGDGRDGGAPPSSAVTNPAGLKEMVTDRLDEIDAASINSIPLGTDAQGTAIVARVGRYGPYLQRGDDTASLPDDIAPDELTIARAEELLEAPNDDRLLGDDPESGRPVMARNGRFGPYVQLGDPADGKPEKTASLFSSMSLDTIQLSDALKLLTLPRSVGPHPEDGEAIVVANGRYGPYLKWGKETRSLGSESELFTVNLDDALRLLAQEKANARERANPILRELGADAMSGQPMSIRNGRFGAYVTDGEVNASLRKGDLIEELSDERASELLQMRRERMATKGTTPARKKAAKKKATSGATRKATRKVPASKVPASKTARKKTATAKKTAATKNQVE